MTLKNKINEIALFICSEYPNLDFNNLSRSHSCVKHICSVFFKAKKNKDINKTVVNSLKNKKSTPTY